MHKSHTASAGIRKVFRRGVVTATAVAVAAGISAPVTAFAAPSKAAAGISATDHARVGTTDDQEARRLEYLREIEKANAERQAQSEKSQALRTVGIPITPELLALGDEEFIRAVMKHSAAGPEVKAEAERALAGDRDAWREFIANGVRTANRRDVLNEVKEVQDKLREEERRRQEIPARKLAAALFGIVPTEAMLDLGDDTFIRELLRLTPDDPQKAELLAAARQAVNSQDPADWKQFIHTGADQAYKRDFDLFMKKNDDANREQVRRPQTAAQESGMNR